MPQCSNEQMEKIWYQLRLVSKKMRGIGSAISKEYGLTTVQLYVIAILDETPDIILNELSEKLGLSKSTVSNLIERMESQGIVIRKIPKENRRIVRLSLSPDFINNHKHLKDLKDGIINKALNFENISIEDAEMIICGIEKLNDLFIIHNDDG